MDIILHVLHASYEPALPGCVYIILDVFVSSADGIALGAAASTSQASVQLIVFVAIMLHKVKTFLITVQLCYKLINSLIKSNATFF